MRLCFLDYTNWDYNADAPKVRPLGGSQSALCYLSMELAKAGHEVTILTGTKSPGIVAGVECLNLHQQHGMFFLERKFDVAIVLNSCVSGTRKALYPASTRLILWTQHEPVQPAMQALAHPETVAEWDHIVCVSNWQRGEYLKEFKIDPGKLTVLRNAIAPVFERLFRDPADLARAKSNPLTLAYTSTPYRGLHLLQGIFPEIRKGNPEARLDVYSSMAVYPKHESYDSGMFAMVYDALRAMEGVDYVGSVPQPELADRLATSHILAYPNIFPETSCIAVMEALAAGLKVVTSDHAALPETCEGFATLVPIDFKDPEAYVERYAKALLQTCDLDPGALYSQVVHMNQHHTWAIRARQWEEFLQSLD